MTEPRVISFNSLDDAYAHIEAAREAAVATELPEQVAIRDEVDIDHWFVRVTQGLVIFGVVPSAASMAADERATYGPPAEELDPEDQAEFGWTIAAAKEQRARGYLFSRCFSEIEPAGELGDTFYTEMTPITQAQFEDARGRQWVDLNPHVARLVAMTYLRRRALAAGLPLPELGVDNTITG